MNPWLTSFTGSIVLRLSAFAAGAVATAGVPHGGWIILALAAVSWVAEHYSLKGWHEYQRGRR